jgi:hypothetical protein
LWVNENVLAKQYHGYTFCSLADAYSFAGW